MQLIVLLYLLVCYVGEDANSQVGALRVEQTVLLTNEGLGRVVGCAVFEKPNPELKENDQIVAVNGQNFSNGEVLLALLDRHRTAGIELTVKRKEQETLSIRVDKRAGQPLGLGCKEDKHAGMLYVSKLSGVAAESELREDDYIVSVNGRRLNTLQQLREAVGAAQSLIIEVIRPSGEEDEEEGMQQMTVEIVRQSGQPLGLGCKENKQEGTVHISSLGGQAKSSQLQVFDRIVSVNGNRIGTLKELREAVSKEHKLQIRVSRPADSQEVNVTVMGQPGDPIGAFPDEQLSIVRIAPGSNVPFKMGDIVKRVNNVNITEPIQFARAVEQSWAEGQPATVTVNRSLVREKETVLQQLPSHLEKLVQRHSGFDYLAIDVTFEPNSNRHFGMALANCSHNKVVVTNLQDNSVSADFFKLFDRLIAVNGTPVTDEGVAKNYICAAGGNFQAVVERSTTPESKEALKREYELWAAARAAKQKESEMPVDVQEIVVIETTKRKAAPVQSAPSALRKSVLRKPGGLSFGDSVEVHIKSDVPEDKKLRRL